MSLFRKPSARLGSAIYYLKSGLFKDGNGQIIKLTPTERKIMLILINQVLTDGDEYIKTRYLAHAVLSGRNLLDPPHSLADHVKNIRRKIEKDPAHPVYLENSHGDGYRLNIQVEDCDISHEEIRDLLNLM